MGWCGLWEGGGLMLGEEGKIIVFVGAGDVQQVVHH